MATCTAARNWRWTADDRCVGALQAGDRPLVVAEQGIDDGGRWDEPIGSAEHDGEIDIEAGRTGQRADVHAVADACRGGPG